MFDHLSMLGYSILAVIVVIGITLGMYLSSYCECSDDEDYERTTTYLDEETFDPKED